MSSKSVLFVCLGNICRSPACEGICKSITKGSVQVESAGTYGYHIGESPDDRSQQACRENGVDISSHRGRKISQDDWTKFKVIAALDDSVLSDLKHCRPSNATAKLVLFNAPAGVDDPYYGNLEGFRKMYQLISKIMPSFLTEHGLL
jgi:protein-tyrosine phosphatase